MEKAQGKRQCTDVGQCLDFHIWNDLPFANITDLSGCHAGSPGAVNYICIKGSPFLGNLAGSFRTNKWACTVGNACFTGRQYSANYWAGKNCFEADGHCKDEQNECLNPKKPQ